jgi:hypothetical protein
MHVCDCFEPRDGDDMPRLIVDATVQPDGRLTDIVLAGELVEAMPARAECIRSTVASIRFPMSPTPRRIEQLPLAVSCMRGFDLGHAAVAP